MNASLFIETWGRGVVTTFNLQTKSEVKLRITVAGNSLKD